MKDNSPVRQVGIRHALTRGLAGAAMRTTRDPDELIAAFKEIALNPESQIPTHLSADTIQYLLELKFQRKAAAQALKLEGAQKVQPPIPPAAPSQPFMAANLDADPMGSSEDPEEGDPWQSQGSSSSYSPLVDFLKDTLNNHPYTPGPKFRYIWMGTQFDEKRIYLISTAIFKANGLEWNMNGTTGEFKKLRDCGENVLLYENGRPACAQKEVVKIVKARSGEVMEAQGTIFLWAAHCVPGREFRFWLNELSANGRNDINKWRKVMTAEDAPSAVPF